MSFPSQHSPGRASPESHDLLFPETARIRAALGALVGQVAAERLIRAVGPHGVMTMQPRELVACANLPLATAERVVAARVLGAALLFREGLPASLPKEVAEALPPELMSSSTEHLVVLAVSSSGRVVGGRCLSSGAVNAVACHPVTVFGHVLRHGANRFVVAHNHPSGDASPSEEDLHFTNRLALGARVLGLQFLDHLIVGGGRFFSFFDAGILPTDAELDALMGVPRQTFEADFAVVPNDRR